MSWIKTIGYTEADMSLRKIYDRVSGSGQQIDNILLAHSLRPHTLMGHMTLYKNVLHHSSNKLPKSFLECLGVCVSLLNHCDYCVQHHQAGLRRLLDDDHRYRKVVEGLENFVTNGGLDQEIFSPLEIQGLRYAVNLTRRPDDVTQEMIQDLRSAGLDDGTILEINQVVAYFAYANRTVLGLGVTIAGETLGLSPGDSSDPNNWTHG